MSDETLEAYIRQMLEPPHAAEVTLTWQGGEPTLMGLDFYRRALDVAARYRKPGQKIRHCIQTNGVGLDDAWCAFFKEQGFLVGLSLDGPREMHDAYRLTKGGAGTFDQVLRGYATLRRHEVDVNILCTIHAANADHPLAVYRFFRDDLQAEFFQFIPIVERVRPALLPLANRGWGERPGGERPLYVQNGNLVTERSVGAEQFGRFMIAIFDEWVHRDVGKVFVQTFDVTLGNHLGQYNLCIFAPTCGRAVCLEHNGDLYSCDHYVEPAYRLGNIKETPLADLVASRRQREFGQAKHDSLPGFCRRCDVRFACHGECPRNRFLTTPDGEPGLNYLCAGYKMFFHHVAGPMKTMADLLREGRSAGEIMTIHQATGRMSSPPAVAKPGRNDPCPCGSGKKFKNCHGGGGSTPGRR